MTEEELLEIVSTRARAGSVPAAKLAWEMLQSAENEDPEPSHPLDQIDALAQRRMQDYGEVRDRLDDQTNFGS